MSPFTIVSNDHPHGACRTLYPSCHVISSPQAIAYTLPPQLVSSHLVAFFMIAILCSFHPRLCLSYFRLITYPLMLNVSHLSRNRSQLVTIHNASSSRPLSDLFRCSFSRLFFLAVVFTHLPYTYMHTHMRRSFHLMR